MRQPPHHPGKGLMRHRGCALSNMRTAIGLDQRLAACSGLTPGSPVKRPPVLSRTGRSQDAEPDHAPAGDDEQRCRRAIRQARRRVSQPPKDAAALTPTTSNKLRMRWHWRRLVIAARTRVAPSDSCRETRGQARNSTSRPSAAIALVELKQVDRRLMLSQRTNACKTKPRRTNRDKLAAVEPAA